MDKYLIFATNGILLPLSEIDKFHNSKVIELNKEDAERLVEQLNTKEGKERYYTMSLNDYSKMKMHHPPIEELDKWMLSLGEELRKDPKTKQDLDKLYEEHDNNINGLDLPKTVNSKEEYFEKAQEMLDAFARQVDRPAFNSQPDLKTEIEAICGKVKEALEFAISGDIKRLDTALQEVIQTHFFDDFIVSELDKSYAFRGLAPFEDLHSHGGKREYDKMNAHDIELFRARVSEEPITKQSEMVNLPYMLRDRARDMRFSAKEQICLYLGTTTYVCSKECQWDGNKDLYMSCFKPNEKGKKLRILNLVISEYLINGLGKNRDIQNKLLKIFPLVIATSFSIKKHTNDVRHDYLISQRLINILRDLKIDGVAYLSCRGESALQYPHGVNLAIPVYDICEEKQYGEICECFTITDPLAVNKIDDNVQIGSKSTLINDIYTEKNKFGDDNIMSRVTDNGKDIFYGNTPFSVWDNYLVNRQFTNFKE